MINLPERIWVFGGIVATGNNLSLSFRDSFWRQTLSCTAPYEWLEHLDQPEAYPSWLEFSGYNDLLEFERDASYLARGVLLFPESPGSFAELGALAIDDSILPRLLVVTESRFLQDPNRNSFLSLGPLKRVTPERTCVISPATKVDVSPEDFKVIGEMISAAFHPKMKSALLNPTNPTHQLLLLADLVDLFLVSKASDLSSAAANFGVTFIGAKLERSLLLLEFFSLVRRERRGKEVFWVRVIKSSAPWIDYKAKTLEKRFDRSRFKVQCRELVFNDPSRKSIYERPQ